MFRHPQLDWGSHDLVKKRQIPDQVWDDGKKNKIAMSHTPHNAVSRHYRTECKENN